MYVYGRHLMLRKFVVVTAVAALLNWVTRNDTQHENTEFPVLK